MSVNQQLLQQKFESLSAAFDENNMERKMVKDLNWKIIINFLNLI
jgi:hypothetical protein